MVKYGELEQALLLYTCGDIHENIPVDYYQRVMKSCIRASNKGLCWDAQQAAAILLYLAFNDGILQPNQLNAEGLKILDYAEKFLDQIKTAPDQQVLGILYS